MKQTPNGCGEWQQVLRAADRYAYALWEALLIAIYLPEGNDVHIHI
jgi:predicted nucleic acid-binding protein